MNTFQSKFFLLKNSSKSSKIIFSVVCVLAYVDVTMPARTFTSALGRKFLLLVIKFSERASALDPITA